jgi:hypothetical protein
MIKFVRTVFFFAGRICIGIGIVILAVAAVLIVGGLFGILFGGSTTIVLFGISIALGVLGASAVKLGIVLAFVGFAFVVTGFALLLFDAVVLSWLAAHIPASFSFPAAGAVPGDRSRIPRLPGWPDLGLPGPGEGLGLLQLLLLAPEQRAKLPPDILRFVDCLRKCFCEAFCRDEKGSGSPGAKPPGRGVPDPVTLLEELKAELEQVNRRIADALRAGNFKLVGQLSERADELANQIRELGG